MNRVKPAEAADKKASVIIQCLHGPMGLHHDKAADDKKDINPVISMADCGLHKAGQKAAAWYDGQYVKQHDPESGQRAQSGQAGNILPVRCHCLGITARSAGPYGAEQS